jgi:hypothetical protein
MFLSPTLASAMWPFRQGWMATERALVYAGEQGWMETGENPGWTRITEAGISAKRK